MILPGLKTGKRVGKGSQAGVYESIQLSCNRRVAVKAVDLTLIDDPTEIKRLDREGKILASIPHPHIVRIFDAGMTKRHFYLVLEWMGGGTLKQRIKAGLCATMAIKTTQQLASAVEYLDKKNTRHRDIKPSNCLYADTASTTVKLADFSIAKPKDGTDYTGAGKVIGSLPYMSPEQISGMPLDVRAELYSLMVMFFEMLTQRRPYPVEFEDFETICNMILNNPVPKLPAELAVFQKIIDRGLAKDPDQRFQTPTELINELDKVRKEYQASSVGSQQSSQSRQLGQNSLRCYR